jgi:hypothetical protein
MGEARLLRNPDGCGTFGAGAAFSGGNQLEERHMADEKEVIVTDGGGGGSGAIIAVVLVLALLVVLFLVFGRGLMNGNNPTDIKADVKVDTPATNR